MVIPDIFNDDRFEQSFLVDKENVHFYLSSPLLSHSNGKKIGTLFLMDHHPRHDFDSEQQLFVREISHILATIICEQRGIISSDKPARLERSSSTFMQMSEERVLSLIKIPLRNAMILQKTMQDFHRFLTISQKSKATSPSPSQNGPGDNKEKIEHFRKMINDRKQLVQNSVELGQLSLQSYQHYLDQTRQRFVVANASSPVPPLHLHKLASPNSKGKFHTVKEWLNGVKTYMTFLKDPHQQSSPAKKSVGMTKIDWTHEESEYIEIEESPRHCYEIFGKLIEFIILSSYHRWGQISVNVSISDEKDHQRKKPTTDHPHNKPYSDNSVWQRQQSSNSFHMGSDATTALDPTGRIHIDITSHPKQHQTTHLTEEMMYYAQCEEFSQSLLRLIHGSMTIVNRGLGNVNGERKTIMIPCQIREKKVKTSVATTATSLINAVNTSGKNATTPKSEKTINLFHQTSSHPIKQRRKSTANKSNKLKKSQFFTDEDDDDDLAKIEDLDEIYGPTHVASASSSTSGSHDENEEQNAEANSVDERGMRKNVSVLGEFRHDMVHMKKGKNVGASNAPTSLSAKFSASSLSSHRSNGNDLSQHGASFDDCDSITPAPLSGSQKVKSQSKPGFFQSAFRTYVGSKQPSPAPAVNQRTVSSRFVAFFSRGRDQGGNNTNNVNSKISVKPQKSDYQQRAHNYHYAHNQSSQFLGLLSRFFGAFPASKSSPSNAASVRQAGSASKKKGSGPPPRGYRQRKVVPVQKK